MQLRGLKPGQGAVEGDPQGQRGSGGRRLHRTPSLGCGSHKPEAEGTVLPLGLRAAWAFKDLPAVCSWPVSSAMYNIRLGERQQSPDTARDLVLDGDLGVSGASKYP